MSADPFSIWKAWTRGPSGIWGARFGAQAWLAVEVAYLLRAHVGPDHDVVYRHRLVSMSEWVPIFAGTEGASDEAIREAIGAAAVRAAGTIAARFAA